MKTNKQERRGRDKQGSTQTRARRVERQRMKKRGRDRECGMWEGWRDRNTDSEIERQTEAKRNTEIE